MENLEKYFEIYEKKLKDTFFNMSFNELMSIFIENEIYDLEHKEQSIRIIENEIINIDDSDKKIKLMPLILFIGKDFYLKLLESDFFDDIKEFIFDELKKIYLKIDLKKYDKYSMEYEYLSSLNTQLNSNNLNTIYNFGINPNIFNYQYADFIYSFALKYDFQKYCNILDKKDVFTFLNLVINFDDLDKLKNIRMKLDKNKYIINIILLKKLSSAEGEVIIDIIKDFSNYKIWLDFIEFVFQLNNKIINKRLAQIISTLSVEKVNSIANYISFEQNIDDFFFNIQNKNYQKLIAFQLYKKWKKYIRTNKNIIEMNLTSLINAIVYYVQNCLNKDKRRKVINKILQKLNNINNIWFYNYNEYLECLYYHLTILFAYSYQMGYKELEIKNILNKYPQFKKKNYIGKMSVIEIFNQSFRQGKLQ